MASRSEVLSIVVADGAGSARCGGKGAELACEVAQRDIEAWVRSATQEWGTQEWIAPALMTQWFESVRNALTLAAAGEDASLRDFACTLLIAVVAAEGAAYGHIGDGGIVTDTGAGLELVFWPESGEYANMTRFVTDEDGLEHVRILCSTTAPEEIAVFTDGIQRLALNFRSSSVHSPFFDPMLAVLRQQAAEDCEVLDHKLALFLGSERVNSRTDDDKTLVLATRRKQLQT
jgi:hypothetical protein